MLGDDYEISQSDVRYFVYAYNTASWAIEKAIESEEGRFYNLLNAQIFMAFMFEGVVDHLCSCLDKDWLQRPEKKEKRVWEASPVKEKHSEIRKKLSNKSSEFAHVYEHVNRVLSVRDSLAHPRRVITDGKPSLEAKFFSSAEEGKTTFDLLEEYLNFLSQKTYLKITSITKDSKESYEKYPHLIGESFDDLKMIFLVSESMSGWKKAN